MKSICCILLCIGFGYSVELQPSSELIEVCSGTTVQVNCTTGTDYLLWRTSPECQVSYYKDDTDLVGDTIQRCEFEAILLSTNLSLMSSVIFRNLNSANNGTVLTCLNTILVVNLGPDQMASTTIVTKGPPSAPLSPSFSPQSLSSVVLSWTPSDADCVVKYTIILTNITEGNASYIYNTTANSTSMTVSDLTQGAEYSFTVAGIDGEDRVGDYSALSEMLTLDVPDAVHDLNATVTVDVIIITWMPPPPSSRPPVTEYKITHNNIGSFPLTKISDTEYIVEYTTPGMYQFTVLAYNVLGDGTGTTIVVTVQPSMTTSSTVSSSARIGVGAHDSDVNSASTASPPTESPSPVPITTLFIIVVGVILALLLIVTLSTGILAGNLYRSRRKLLRYNLSNTRELTLNDHSSGNSVVTTQFGDDRKMSPTPTEDGEHSEVLLTDQKEPPTLRSPDCSGAPGDTSNGYSSKSPSERPPPLPPQD